MSPRAVVAAVLLVLAAAGPAGAEPPPLLLPLDCRLGDTCWVLNYADADPGPEVKDYTCRPRAYARHDGTDFALRDIAAMRRGVAVRAAAGGRVVAVHDGEREGEWLAGRRKEMLARRKECGNRVTIAHADGWTTDYCHLRPGSVTVRVGDQVGAGQPLGLVGLSGRTDFPHAHITVKHLSSDARSGTPVDPFTGTALAAGCGRRGEGLWATPIPYQPVSFYAAGIAPAVPAKGAIKKSAAAPARLTTRAPALVVWAAFFGAAKGDVIRVRLQGPGGATLVDKVITVDGNQAWRTISVGRKRAATSWPAGTYRGTVSLQRAGLGLQTRTLAVEVAG